MRADVINKKATGDLSWTFKISIFFVIKLTANIPDPVLFRHNHQNLSSWVPILPLSTILSCSENMNSLILPNTVTPFIVSTFLTRIKILYCKMPRAHLVGALCRWVVLTCKITLPDIFFKSGYYNHACLQLLLEETE